MNIPRSNHLRIKNSTVLAKCIHLVVEEVASLGGVKNWK